MLPLIENTQAPEKSVADLDGLTLEVQGRPWLTLQGEGPLAGRPAVFVRLAGCTLKCRQCDTDYTSQRSDWSLDTLVEWVLELSAQPRVTKVIWGSCRRIVVLTGGEPFRQNLGPLVRRLTWDHSLLVQVETNGREAPVGMAVHNPLFRVVVSPKLEVHEDIWKVAQTAKYVVRAGRVSAEDGLPVGVLGYAAPPARPPKGWPGVVYVQPEDDADPALNRANAEECIRVAMEYGYTVSTQQHKLLNLP